MKHIALLLAILLFPAFVYAGDAWVNGYYRSDGTYVQGHYRSAPDGQKWNNYGPKSKKEKKGNYFSPYTRDNDRDGTSNYLDMDDDNDGILDNYDSNQYGSGNSGGLFSLD